MNRGAEGLQKIFFMLASVYGRLRNRPAARTQALSRNSYSVNAPMRLCNRLCGAQLLLSAYASYIFFHSAVIIQESARIWSNCSEIRWRTARISSMAISFFMAIVSLIRYHLQRRCQNGSRVPFIIGIAEYARIKEDYSHEEGYCHRGIRAVRHRISEQFDHDTSAFLNYYRGWKKIYKKRMLKEAT